MGQELGEVVLAIYPTTASVFFSSKLATAPHFLRGGIRVGPCS